jgi:hypothetical protein
MPSWSTQIKDHEFEFINTMIFYVKVWERSHEKSDFAYSCFVIGELF